MFSYLGVVQFLWISPNQTTLNKLVYYASQILGPDKHSVWERNSQSGGERSNPEACMHTYICMESGLLSVTSAAQSWREANVTPPPPRLCPAVTPCTVYCTMQTEFLHSRSVFLHTQPLLRLTVSYPNIQTGRTWQSACFNLPRSVMVTCTGQRAGTLAVGNRFDIMRSGW